MANDNSEPVNVVPTAIHLQEPRFPDVALSTMDSQNQPKVSGESETPKEPATTNHVSESKVTPVVNNSRHIRRTQTDIAPGQRPILGKSNTERPQPQARSSFIPRKRAGTTDRPNNLGRQVTLTFDPYSSDSSSSSDDDEPSNTARTDFASEGQTKDKQPRKTTRSSEGPFSKFRLDHEHFNSKGKVSKRDGRLNLSINETLNSGYFAKTLGAGLKKHLKSDDTESLASDNGVAKVTKGRISPEDDIMENPKLRIKLNIVVIVIGSRGDIQPFLKIGKILKEDYGHRVRIATHPAFKKFVEEDSKLEFFSVGGDPSELMAFMVKNPGLVPSLDTIKDGEIGKRRAAMYEMFQGMWRACINSTDDEDDKANLKMMGGKHPFIADAIIANPPSFAPPHIAEKLGIPLHMMFTFPYTPTVKFPHPLANIKTSNVDAQYTNFMSYPLVEMMTWQGLGDLINRFRVKSLCLEEVSTLWAPGQLYRLKVPYTYMWSPGLVPKPKDWGPEIDLSGFVFLDLASSFTPPDDLQKFLDAGEAPIYIGFGSIVVDDPDQFTKLIFKAVELAGVRALVSKGWGGFGSNESAPDNVFMLENTPHDWLFPKVRAVVHHGGAGTTAIGLKCGIPTMIVPFFGDQPFWGDMVSKAKAGAHDCIPYKKLTAERLAEGIKQCLTDEAKQNVQKIADSIAKEGDGAVNAVQSFHRSLPLYNKHNMRCQMLENRVAAWTLKGTDLRLSSLAAELLVEWKKIKWNELRLARHFEWNDFGGPGEPITGIWSVIVGTVEDVFTGVGLVPVNMAKSVKKREKYYEKKWKLKKRQKHNQARISEANKNSEPKKEVDGAQENGRPSVKRQESSLSKISEPDEWLAEEFAHEAGHGFKKTGASILKSPMYFTLAVAQGFHNAPRLYGDETVRRPPRVTGFHSGIRAGRDEFVHGIHDGVTGVWRLPIKGAKEGGVLGCMRGVAMGIGGLFLKDIAAFLGPGAYTMKGLDEEHRKKYQPTNFIRRARIIQGQKDVAELGPRISRQKSGSGAMENGHNKRQEVELEISRRWEAVQSQIAADKKKHKTGIRASLLGRSQDKGGTHIERKASRANIEPPGGVGHPKKSSSTPTNQAAGLSEGPVPGVDQSHTSPDVTTESNKGSRKKKLTLDPVPNAVKDMAKTESNSKVHVPNVFQASLEGNGRPVGDFPFEPIKEEENPNINHQAKEERPRSRSDTTDWVSIRKEAEGDRSQSH